jgi:hypothetical protein
MLRNVLNHATNRRTQRKAHKHTQPDHNGTSAELCCYYTTRRDDDWGGKMVRLGEAQQIKLQRFGINLLDWGFVCNVAVKPQYKSEFRRLNVGGYTYNQPDKKSVELFECPINRSNRQSSRCDRVNE